MKLKKILARKTDTSLGEAIECYLYYPSIEAAKKNNPYFNEFTDMGELKVEDVEQYLIDLEEGKQDLVEELPKQLTKEEEEFINNPKNSYFNLENQRKGLIKTLKLIIEISDKSLSPKYMYKLHLTELIKDLEKGVDITIKEDKQKEIKGEDKQYLLKSCVDKLINN